ncbi:polysaccharide export outer membrane protein [Neorhizobium galegae]|uniref:polysaccharide biosynthesis/export family protein n=1 Tax=Neorhizobium galegae TaxID=399 RepID=UPI001AE3E298|nr:polysaccharide biosynthesis/export family protein [Neorhizobium galegae]MBP2547973.1 polysaccharide export outer membrane protein [Neorhizobium galegae]
MMTNRILAIAIAGLLAGCTSLPRSGPDQHVVDSGAAVTVGTGDQKVGIDYALVDINSAVLSHISGATEGSLSRGFGARRDGIPDIVLGVGDVVQVSVFEAQSGGLFIPADAGARPGNYITLPNQTVDRQGNISVPYAGSVSAVGKTVSDLQIEIASRLANRAIEPQVVVSVIESHSMEAAVLGDVNNPKKITLSPSGERILDIISEAGGLSAAAAETSITLQRRGKQATAAYNTLARNSAENIYVQPGDTIIVRRDKRTYLAFGVTGQSGSFDFEDTDLTLGDALAKAGGLLDDKAEPKAVLLYRNESKHFLASLGVDTSRFKSDTVPVIFRANLRDPSGFFSVQKFPMQNKDVLYVSTSDAVELTKFLTILNSATSSVNNVANTRDTIRNQ